MGGPGAPHSFFFDRYGDLEGNHQVDGVWHYGQNSLVVQHACYMDAHAVSPSASSQAGWTKRRSIVNFGSDVASPNITQMTSS